MEVQTTERVRLLDTLGGKEQMLFSCAVREFCTDYAWQKGYAKATVNNYRWTASSFLKAVDDKPITQITLDDIKTWRRYMDSHQYEDNAINAYLYKFRRLMVYYSKHHRLAFDPDDIIIPKKTQQAPKFLTKEEIDTLIDNGDVREKALIAILYSSGVRVGELTRLRKNDIHGDTLMVRGKGKKERFSFLDERAQHYLGEYLKTRTDTNPYLFYTKKCKGISVGCVQHLVKELGIRSGITTTVTPHVLRHSFATHMAQGGIGSFHLQKLLGHAHISTTQIYVHLSGADLKKAYNKYH